MNMLVQANLKFVVAVCRNYKNQGLPMGDLINEGNLGLIRAAQRFEAGLPFKFISYAVWWIRQSILTALAEQSRILNISAGRVGIMHKIGKANRKLEQKLGRQPQIADLAEEMNLTAQEITECLQLGSVPYSLDAPRQGDEDGSFGENLRDDRAEPTDGSAQRFFIRENIRSLIRTLTEREAKVLRLYYGIGSETTYTLEEIAEGLNLTRERVRQIKDKALERLRHPSRMKKLDSLEE